MRSVFSVFLSSLSQESELYSLTEYTAEIHILYVKSSPLWGDFRQILEEQIIPME